MSKGDFEFGESEGEGEGEKVSCCGGGGIYEEK